MSICGQTCSTPTPSQAHCPTCHRTFGGVTGFDAHRSAGDCLDPSTKGYVETKGIWRLPIDEVELERRRGLRTSGDATDDPESLRSSSPPP